MTSKYQYTTSPRKVNPEVVPRRKQNLRVVKDVEKKKATVNKAQREQQKMVAKLLILIFIALLTISYRNSQINESFSKVQNLKAELAQVQKENEQLKVNIENNMNLKNIEQVAKEKLGMQNLSGNNSVYINLPKKDYTETASEKVKIEDEGWLQKIINTVKSWFNIE